MKANDIFNNAIESRKCDLRYAKERIAHLRGARKHAMPILKHLAPLLGVNDRAYVSAMAFEGGDEYLISINVELHKLDGFKDQRLENMLYAVMCLADVKVMATKDWPSMMNRDYKFSVGEGSPVTIDITIGAYIRDNSETCRKVKVGETMEVVAQYEFQCD